MNEQHKEQQGFLTVVSNTDTTNYLELAHIQALNIKATQKIKNYAIIVDYKTAELITDKHKKVFDYIIETDPSQFGPFGLEPKVFWLTPFKETVKLESDLLLCTSIDHWWPTFRLKNIFLSHGCKNYKLEKNKNRNYRKFFDDNNLPDVYSGLMYFRYSQQSYNFFSIANKIFEFWDQVSGHLINCRNPLPTTDEVYAITADIIGREYCTVPTLDFINFVHMKPGINGYHEQAKIKDMFVTEFDSGMLRINNLNQYHPIHYYEKDFLTEEIYDYFRSVAGVC